MVYVLGLSLVVGVLVLTVPSTASEITATVDIHPKTLNLNSTGMLITVYIELPETYNVEDINVTTVQLETVQAAWGNVEGNKLMVKFDRQTVIGYIWDRLYHMRFVPLTKEVKLTARACDVHSRICTPQSLASSGNGTNRYGYAYALPRLFSFLRARFACMHECCFEFLDFLFEGLYGEM